jgi:broad specificity phosphatase PhoE
VESAAEVRSRVVRLVKQLEEKFDDKVISVLCHEGIVRNIDRVNQGVLPLFGVSQIIFLVSHGDALQIAQTAFARMPMTKHRSFVDPFTSSSPSLLNFTICFRSKLSITFLDSDRSLKHLEPAEIRELPLAPHSVQSVS